MRRALAATLLALLAAAPPAQAKGSTSGQLRAGAGQADITPPKTGYYLGGWTRADRKGLGVSTRLHANTLVLQRGTKKLALVAADIFAIAAGMQEDVAREVADLGFDRTSVLLAASHTHSGPGGYTNNPLYNTAAPSPETIGDPSSFVNFLNAPPADRQLYTFIVKQIAASIRRANADRTLAVAAWGHTRLTGVTQNRSLSAFLRNYGIVVAADDAKPEMDPKGPDDTIDPNVDVLRVDKLVRHGRRTRRVPIGAYSNFADHGTVVNAENQVYSGDHHAAAARVFADKVRKAAKVPRNQTVVNVYPNGAEGDMSAGLVHQGIDAARRVGSTEADAMFEAWRKAGTRLSRTPALDWRWTRACFCGRMTATGRVDSGSHVGVPFLTGSEEGRGPLFDLTGVSLEGASVPFDDPVQGTKLAVPGIGTNGPPAVPVGVYRVGDGVIATIPGEPTKQIGVHVRKAVLDAMPRSGVTHALIGGLAFDFIQYVTTPAEYGAQSYEGGSTLYGKHEGTFLQERLAELGKALAEGKPAPAPHPYDPSYGVKPDGPPYPAGADKGTLTAQPAKQAARGDVIKLAWTGGANGSDRPVDKAFITAERSVGKRWRAVDSDLALDMIWRDGGAGRYTLEWRPARTVPAGAYRLRVTATRYELISDTFELS